MNERIKKLYNQSLEAKYQYGGNGTKPDEMYSNYITVLNPEKFAELLIREALDLCYSRGMNDELYAGQLKAAAYIEEHFGVE